MSLKVKCIVNYERPYTIEVIDLYCLVISYDNNHHEDFIRDNTAIFIDFELKPKLSQIEKAVRKYFFRNEIIVEALSLDII